MTRADQAPALRLATRIADLALSVSPRKETACRLTTVYIDDNYHFSDDDECYAAGVFDTLNEAIAYCEKRVREELVHNLSQKPEQTAKELYAEWSMFGEDPWISAGGFSAREFAGRTCEQIVAQRAAL